MKIPYVCMASAKETANTFFIFREDGVEVVLEIKEDKLHSTHRLTDDERVHVKNCVQKSEHELVYESLINTGK